MADTPNTAEVRFDAPRRCIDVIDAVSVARKIKRNELLVQILEEWTEQTIREVTAVVRVTMTGTER